MLQIERTIQVSAAGFQPTNFAKKLSFPSYSLFFAFARLRWPFSNHWSCHMASVDDHYLQALRVGNGRLRDRERDRLSQSAQQHEKRPQRDRTRHRSASMEQREEQLSKQCESGDRVRRVAQPPALILLQLFNSLEPRTLLSTGCSYCMLVMYCS